MDRGGLRYAIVAGRSNPRYWLLPLDARRPAAAALEMLQPIAPAAKLAKRLARGVARFGPLHFLGRGRIHLSGLPNLAGAFEDRAAHVAYFTGTEGPHRKTAVQVMTSDGSILGYGKLSRTERLRPYLRNEAAMLNRIAALALKTADVPRVLALRDDDLLTLLVTDSVKSSSHTAPRMPGAEHLTFLEELRTRTERPNAQTTLDALAHRAAALASVAGPEWTSRLTRVEAALRPVADHVPVCFVHGDFTPWNTFLQDGRLYVFDWEYANELWPVGFDLAHFHLATTPPEEQVASLPRLSRALAGAYFNGDNAMARRSLLLCLACHAVFYLGRLLDAGSALAAWAEGPERGAMIDRLLAADTGDQT